MSPRGQPAMSFGFAGRGAGGMDPISLSDISQYGGVQLPNAVMSNWLARVQKQGGQSLEAEGAGRVPRDHVHQRAKFAVT